MKNIFFTIAAVALIAFTGVSQEKINTAQTEGNTELLKSKKSREYSFVMPHEISTERVEKSAKYYTSYFSVNYNPETREASIQMNEERTKGEMVMGRFLSSCGVRFLKVDDKNITLDEFMNSYLR